MALRDEILEQPAALQRVLATQLPEISRVARAISRREVDYVLVAARGTSDHAGIYAQYLWGAFNGLPVALATPSLVSLYGASPRFRHALVVGISQSGRSPDVVGVIAEGKHQGALTLAITNDVTSALAGAADLVLDISAGPERAVAATKTYTCTLLVLAALSLAMAQDTGRAAELRHVPDAAAQVLRQETTVQQIAHEHRAMNRCVVLGRGYSYSTAQEWALKLKELAYVLADPYSAADFQHGPIAIVGSGFPVLAVAPRGAVYADMLALLRRLRNERANLIIISDDNEALELSGSPLYVPAGLPEWLMPLVSIIPAQLYCYHLTRAKGYDPEAPRGLHKVTLTQ
jgi:glucosamine--fructose-6-phosphate aminotransferase (isomerizing)